MKSLVKLSCTYLILVCSLLACNPTSDFINDVEEESMVGKPMRRSAGSSVANALTFDSIAQADEILEAMQSIDNASEFYDTYIRNNNVSNKYLTSIHEYLSMLNNMDAGDTITALLALEALQDSLFNVVIEDGDTIVEPLSNYDYRCLVNEDNVFVVGDRVYHLFDTIFITCPISQHAHLVEISNNPMSMQLLLDELKTEKKEILDTTMIQHRGIAFGFSENLDVLYIIKLSGTICFNYEKRIGKHKMWVGIECYEKYKRLFNVHKLQTRYRIKSHTKWAGIWWIRRENTSINISYNALFLYGEEARRLLIPIDTTYYAKQFYHSNESVISYPYQVPEIINMGPEYVDFTISNPHLTITENDFKNYNITIEIDR